MVYVIPIFVIVFCIYWYDYLGKSGCKNLIYYGLMVYCVIISGLSYRIGYDIVSFYESEFYDSYVTLSHVSIDYLFHTSGRQPGWMLFASCCKSIMSDFNFMKTVIAFVVNYAMFTTIRRYTENIFCGVLIYLIYIYPYFSFEILRESMAVSIFLLSTKYLERRNLKAFYLCMVGSYSFHESSIIMFLLPLFVNLEFTKKQVYVFAFGALLIMVFQSYLRFIPRFISSFSVFAEKAEMYMESDFFSQTKTFTISKLYSYIFNFFLPFVGIYYIKKDYNYSSSINGMNVIGNIDKYVLIALYINIFSFFFPILFRCANYVNIFFYMFEIRLMCYIANLIKRDFYALRVLFCTIFILYYIIPYYFIPKERYGNIPLIVKIYPYTSIIDKETILERELLYSQINN